MTVATQKRLAIAGACLGVALFLAANAHLVAVAFLSQPGCAAVSPDRAPARPSC